MRFLILFWAHHEALSACVLIALGLWLMSLMTLLPGPLQLYGAGSGVILLLVGMGFVFYISNKADEWKEGSGRGK